MFGIDFFKANHAKTGLGVIGADGAYLIRGHDSPHMTGVVYDHQSQMALSVIHASRDRNMEASAYLSAKVDCSSKTMEKEVTCANLEFLVANGCNITHGVFDGDSAIKSAVLAILSKPSTVPLPVVLALCVWWRRGRFAWRDLIPLVPFFLLET